MALKASELSISVALKCLLAKLVFPVPEGPTRRTREGSGSSISTGHRQLRRSS
jgi:hypothetical protein